jgi:2-succinyl-5-enolpyruvyl-6-hydroxy-3-cyclohexene-1-carboxylate synthase
MTDPVAADVQAAFCSVLVDEWARAGVTDAVIAPGSRSTPLVMALDRDGRIRVHVVLDERGAGFLGLGLGLATGRPAVVVTTSGTAAVELHPAVVEAAHAAIPLIAATADRPPELHGVGAPQTVDQDGLYGATPRWAVSPGVADLAAAASWRPLAARSVAVATGGPDGPGPVHLNLAFRDPLLGTGPAGAPTPAAVAALPPGRAGGGPWHRRTTPSGLPLSGPSLPGPSLSGPPLSGPSLSGLPLSGPPLSGPPLSGPSLSGPSLPGPSPSQSVVAWLAAYAGGRGLIVAGAGAGDPDTLVAAAQALGWPLLADPRSGCRSGGGGPVIAAADALLRIPRIAARHPDVVVRFGAPWASKVLTQWLAGLDPAVVQVLVDPWGRWEDPDRRVEQVIAADPTATAAALLAAVGRPVAVGWGGRVGTGDGTTGPSGLADGSGPARGVRPDPTWVGQWTDAERAAQGVFDRELAAGAPLELSEPGVARAVMAALPDNAMLLASSSMPVRDVEWYSAPRQGLTVLSNRGVNGIDGVLSTAIGVALGGRVPTVALIGDLAFLYDAGALLWSSGRDLALTIVVVDNNGGGIFSFLPQASALAEGEFERYWGTPHRADLTAIARAYGVEVVACPDRRSLDAVLTEVGRPGVRVAVVPSDRAANVVAHDRLNAAVAEAVAAIPVGDG